MRVLIVDTYYPAFIDAVYAADPDLARRPYADQLNLLLSKGFGTADFYSMNLRRLGHVVEDIGSNCVPLQLQWRRENDGNAAAADGASDFEAILLAQIRAFRPDVLHVQDCINISPRLIDEAKRDCGFVTTQVACPFPPDLDFSPYDLVLSSMPHFVEAFRARGIPSELQRLAFESSLIDRVGERPRQGAVFVGGISGAHLERTTLLEELAAAGLIDWWGYGVEELGEQSALRSRYRGQAWGLDMYGVLAGCRVALNIHIDVAGAHANNMRLYEATGMGALLLTDWKSDLSDLFEPGREVVTFRDSSECAERIVRYLSDDDAARPIADAGQRKTLTVHTYAARMAEFIDIVNAYIGRPRSAM